MTWEEKFKALYSLGQYEGAKIILDAYGKFMCTVNRANVREGNRMGFLVGKCHGHADTIQEAVEKCWEYCTELGVGEYLVIGYDKDDGRRAVKWNGYMWEDVKEAD